MSGIKYFFISFSITICVIAVIFVPIYLTITHSKKTENKQLPQNSETIETQRVNYSPDEKDKFNLILGIIDENDDLLTSYLLQLNPVKQQIPVASIPTNIVANVNEQTSTLKEIYKEKGMIGLSNEIQNIFDIPDSKYAKISKKDFITIVNYMGSLEYLIPQNLSYENSEQNIYINIPQGMQSLDGERLYKLMTFPEFNDIPFKQKLYSDIFTAYINQHLDEWYMNNIDSIFSFVINNMDSNISIIDHTRYKNPLLYTITSTENIGTSVFLEFTDSDNGVLVTKESLDLLEAYFK